MVNLLSFLLSLAISLTIFFILFTSIEVDKSIDLSESTPIEINIESFEQATIQEPTKNIEKEPNIGSDLGKLFEDADYKNITKKIQRYDINKIKTVDNTKKTTLNELLKDEKPEDKTEDEKFSINKEYYENTKEDTKEDTKYLRMIQKKLSKVWRTQPDDVGKRAIIIFKISKSGSFVYSIKRIYGDNDFKNRLISSLEKLKLSGFEPPVQYTVITVNFIAKD